MNKHSSRIIAATEVHPGRRSAGEGIFVFIFGDMMMFALFFGSYTYTLGEQPDLFRVSQAHLNPHLAIINALVLLTSSWMVVLATDAARARRHELVPRFLAGAIMGGGAFGIIKIFEYTEKIRAGITPSSNDFYMYYFVLTGTHFAHVVIGLVVLTILYRRSDRMAFGPGSMQFLIYGGAYWHMVDLLWIVLVPLVYLVH